MTELVITPNLAKKKMKLDGVIAAGEKVAVTVKGFGGMSVTDTRLRVYCGKDLIAIFPKVPEEGEEQIPWSVSGDDLTCELDLFTIQAEKATKCGCVNCLFILDDMEAATLYATSEHEILKWIKRGGDDIPIDLSGYKDFVSEIREELDDFKNEMNEAWATYKSEIGDAWFEYKQNIQSQYNSFTQTVRGLVNNKASAQELASHIGNKNNPHEVKIANIPQLRNELDNLGSQITSESGARNNADNALREQIATERNRAVVKENQLAGAIVGEHNRAVKAEENLDLGIRQLGNRIEDAIKVLRGKVFETPKNGRQWHALLSYIVTALGGNIASGGVEPSEVPEAITMKANDGTIRSIRLVYVDGEYTSEVN